MHEIGKYITAWEHTTVWGEHTTAWGGNIPQFWVETYQTGTDHNLGWQNTKQEHTTVCGVNIPQFRVGTNHILGWQNIKLESATVWVGKYQTGTYNSFGRKHTTAWGGNEAVWGVNIPQLGVGTYHLPCQNTKREHTTTWGVSILQCRVETYPSLQC